MAGSILTRGYAAVMRAGTKDTSKFAIDFYRGGFKGTDENITIYQDGDPIDGVDESISTAIKIAQSDEFDNISDLIDWANDDYTFNQYFSVVSSTITGDGSVDSDDLTNNAGNNLFSGATETYSTSDMNDVLEAIANETYDFILAGDSNEDYASADNLKVLAYITNTASVKPDMYVGGGDTASEWSSDTGSIAIAQFYDNEYTTVVHGGPKLAYSKGAGFKEYNSLFKAAMVMGREAGLPPQVPLDFKNIGIIW